LAAQLKDIYTKDFLLGFSKKVHSVYSAFHTADFIASVMDETWNKLALKARTRPFSEKLGVFLPNRYEDALDILFEIADDCGGFPYLFFPDFVAVHGQAEEHWELSMRALENFTQKSSSEFAIRPFLLRDPERIMNRMTEWAKHPNEHVRRLASAHWAIELKDNKKVIGTIDNVAWFPRHYNAEIGFILSKEHWGKGLINEAANKVIEFGFEKMELNKIEAPCMVENVQSQRVLQKLGMRLEGILRHKYFIKGIFRDMAVYSILKEEYKV